MNEKFKMKIGIDAKWLFTGHVSGKHFIENILPELFASHPEVEWHIFLDKKDKHFTLPFTNSMVNIHYVWARFNMLSNLFVLPSYVKQLKLDAVLFQTFCPKGKSFKSIVFVHDVLFTLLNVLGFAKPLRDTVEGLTIIVAAAFTAYRLRRSR